MHIKIQVLINTERWTNHPTYKKAKEEDNCGLDIPTTRDQVIPANSRAFSIGLGILTEPSHAYMLVPRSSITKTPLRLANSIGIIDKSYRGELIAKVDNLSNNSYTLEAGKCYFQIIAFNGILPTWELGEVNVTKRGTKGFGSTTDRPYEYASAEFNAPRRRADY